MIPKTFVPKKEGDLEKILQGLIRSVKDKEGLLISVLDPVPYVSSKLYMWSPNIGKPVKVRDFGFYVYRLHLFNNDIFVGGGDNATGIITSLFGKFHVTRGGLVTAICSHDGKLYDGGRSGAIYETFKYKVVAVRSSTVNVLYSCDGYLVDGGAYKYIHYTMDSSIAYDTEMGVMSMYSDDSKTLFGIFNEILDWETSSSVRRPGNVLTMGSFQGVFYDAGRYPQIYRDMSEADFFGDYLSRDYSFEADSAITSVITVPFYIIEKILDQKFRGRH